MSKRILHIDLHPIATDSRQIDAALQQVFAEAQQKRVKTVEIITGKGSGQLKKRVQRFLQQKDVAKLYQRIENDSGNHGRLFVHFR